MGKLRESYKAAVGTWREGTPGTSAYSPRSAKSNAVPENYTADDGLQLSPVQGAVSTIARAVAGSDIFIQEFKEGSWQIVTNDLPRWADPGLRPNIFQSAYEFKYNFITNYIAGGNGYGVVQTFRRGYPDHIISMPGKDVMPYFPDGMSAAVKGSGSSLRYSVVGDQMRPYNSLDRGGHVFHAKLMTLDSLIRGSSPLESNAPSLRIALAAEAHTELMFSSGGTQPAILMNKGKALTQEKIDTLDDHYVSIRQNPANRHYPLILEGDWEWLSTFLPPDQMQLIDTNKMTYNKVSSCFGVPTPLFGGPEISGWGTGLRSLVRYFHNATIAPVLTHFSLLFTELLPKNRRCLFIPTNFLKAEPLEEARWLERLVFAGILLPSEAREILGKPAISNIDERFENLFAKGNADNGGDSDSGRDGGSDNFVENEV